MANKNVEKFIETYGPVAMQVSKEINVDPNVLLSQWGLESRWGQTEMAKKYHNLGGIKDFTGSGFEAKDNKTGSKGKYVQFEDPEVFGMYYVDQIKRNFPGAINTGPDAGAFARGLASGKRGSYFEISPDEYEKTLYSFQAAIPESKMLPFGSAQPETSPTEVPSAEGELQLVDAPPPGPPAKPYTDTSSADPGDRRLFGILGAGAGAVIGGANAYMEKRDADAVRRAGLEESARIKVRRDETNARTALLREQQAAERLAAMKAANLANVAPGAVPTAAGVAAPADTPPGGLTGGSGPTAQAVRIQQGTTGDLGTTGRQRGEGYNTETSQRAAGKNVATGKVDVLKNLGVVGQDATEFFAAQQGLTTTPSGVLYPRSEPAPSTGARPPQPFQTRTGPKSVLNIPPVPKAAVPTAPPYIPSVLAGAVPDDLSLRPPAPPKSGLAAVGDMFTSMMKPLEPAANAAGRALRPLLGPLGGISAGLDVAELAHEMNKPADQRSIPKIALKGLSAGTGALSMIPGPQQRITVPAALGSSALYEMLYNEELKNYMRNKLGMEPQVTP
jgi:hypothetical protein